MFLLQSVLCEQVHIQISWLATYFSTGTNTIGFPIDADTIGSSTNIGTLVGEHFQQLAGGSYNA